MKGYLIVALVGLLCAVMPVARAELVTIEADGYYTFGDGPEENISAAKERARKDAMRMAGEQACVYVESFSELKNNTLTFDEIRTISSAVVRV